jgi:type I protein arginine methyltransferase
MYCLSDYGRMIADRVRTDAYWRALRAAVTRESVVLDIGTGSGIFALMAAQLGAQRVYAVEPDDVIEVARELAAASGYADRIELIQEVSTKLALPEKASVIISDLRGVLPFFRRNIDSIIDARERLLAPGGVLIPRCDVLWAAVVEAPKIYSDYNEPWMECNYQFDMRAARAMVTNQWRHCRVEPSQLVTDPRCLVKLPYTEITKPDLTQQMQLIACRTGTGHGLCVWFDAVLDDNVRFSNAPGAPELIYSNAFFPWPEPVSLMNGDSVSVAIQANLVGDDYVWRWDTRVLAEGNPNKIKADFKQSTFFGVPLSAARLHKRASHHIPALNEAGLIERFVLSLMDGQNSLEQIAKRLAAEFPDGFTSYDESLACVADLAEKFS